MTFYTPHVPQYRFSDDASPILHTPPPLPLGPTRLPSLHGLEYSPGLLDSNDSLEHQDNSSLFQVCLFEYYRANFQLGCTDSQ